LLKGASLRARHRGSTTQRLAVILSGFSGHSITLGVHRVTSLDGFIAGPEHEMDRMFDSQVVKATVDVPAD
jgi:hypothetical protein